MVLRLRRQLPAEYIFHVFLSCSCLGYLVSSPRSFAYPLHALAASILISSPAAIDRCAQANRWKILAMLPFVALILLAVDTASPAPTHERGIFSRANEICGGDDSLAQCGGFFPADFCCPRLSTCLPLHASGAIATVCCPPGVDCSSFAPTTCQQGAYNASAIPANQIHVSPITALSTCGSGCCVPGYACQDDRLCVAANASAGSNTTTPASTQSLIPISTQSLAPTSTQLMISTAPATASASAVLAAGNSSPTPQAQPSNSPSFSGSSFAAGFMPGIVLGMLLLVGILWLLRRRRNRSIEYNDEKALSKDQLTRLSPMENLSHPHVHKRSISEPAMIATQRTDFLRSSPPDSTQQSCGLPAENFDTIEEEGTPEARRYEPKPLFQFSPSIRHPKSPLPAHMKRGTLSYAISPIRQLRTKKSTQSLRRHAASPARKNSQRSRFTITRSNTSASTETIRILMTPDQRPEYAGPTGRYDHPPLPTNEFTAKQPWTTPSRQPANPQPSLLGSPYSYHPRGSAASTYADASPATKSRRVTTFSSLMERAGLRREDILPDSSI